MTVDPNIVQTVYNYDANVTVSLKNNVGRPVTDADIKIQNINSTQVYKTDENGQTTINLKGLPAGRYQANAVFEGNENCTKSNKTFTITIFPASTEITAPYLTTEYLSNETLTVTLKDKQNEPLSGLPLTVNFNGQTNYTTDENGQITISTEALAPGTYHPYIRFDGNECYAKSAKEISITITKIKSVLTANETSIQTTYYNNREVTITLTDSWGNPINDAALTIYADDKKTYVTDDNGQVTFSTEGLRVRSYATGVLVEFNGNKTYQKSSTQFQVKIDKEPTHLSAEIIPDYMIVTLLDDLGKPRDYADITVNITDSSQYQTDKDSKNYVSLKDIEPGTYEAQISFAGDETYLEDFTNVSVNIPQESDVYQISTEDTETCKGNTIIFDATIFAANKTIDSGKVYFQIDGKPLMDENGTILYSEVEYEMIHQTYTIPEDITIGDYVLTAIYISTDNLKAMDNKTLTITENYEGGSDGEDIPDYSNNGGNFNPLRKDSHTKYSVTKIITTTNTHKVIHDNDIVTQSDVVTLDDLNKIFNQTFNNRHLLVYIDGELVFNGTTSDDLATVIFEIIEKFLGQHEIKVEFTNADNDTKTYTEEITIQ